MDSRTHYLYMEGNEGLDDKHYGHLQPPTTGNDWDTQQAYQDLASNPMIVNNGPQQSFIPGPNFHAQLENIDPRFASNAYSTTIGQSQYAPSLDPQSHFSPYSRYGTDPSFTSQHYDPDAFGNYQQQPSEEATISPHALETGSTSAAPAQYMSSSAVSHIVMNIVFATAGTFIEQAVLTFHL